MTIKINNPKNKRSNKKFNNRKSWKKKTRGNCAAEASTPKENQKSEDPSGSIRDITAHLIHDKNTLIA